MHVDVLIVGGGAAGLWCLDRFRRAGYQAILVEACALGAGQTIQSQGIIHGGGKYALRGVRDFAAVRATSEMPGRWRRCLSGIDQPSLVGTRVLSQECFLWLPRGSAVARAQSWGFISLVARAGLLASRPAKLDRSDWPAVLQDSAVAVYTLGEQVIATGSFLETLAAIHERHIFQCDGSQFRFAKDHVEIAGVPVKPRATVLTAGVGNAALMRDAGIETELMQCRPLTMVLLRGRLPPLFGHCVAGGKTQLTITSPADGLWQVGGEIAERLASENDTALAQERASSEIRRWLPALDLSGIEMALYRAVRAEAKTAELRRPNGVHASYVAPRTLVAWPTKLCLVPALADEVFALLSPELKSPANYEDKPPLWPKPPLARYPWEDAEWSSIA